MTHEPYWIGACFANMISLSPSSETGAAYLSNGHEVTIFQVKYY